MHVVKLENFKMNHKKIRHYQIALSSLVVVTLSTQVHN